MQRGAEEREALLRKLAGKQEVIAYLENKLAERAAAGGAAGVSSQLDRADGAAAAALKAESKAAQSIGSPAGSLEAAAPAPAGQEARQRVASEEEEALPVGEEASSGSPAGPQPTDELLAAEAEARTGAELEGSRRDRKAAVAGQAVQRTRLPSSAAAAEDKTPAPRKQQPTEDNRCAGCVPLLCILKQGVQQCAAAAQ